MGKVQIVLMVCFGFDLVAKAIVGDESYHLSIYGMRRRQIFFVKALHSTIKGQHRYSSFRK